MHASLSYFKKNFKFTETEILFMIVTVLISGFILSFRQWGIGDIVDVKIGFYNLMLTIIIAALNIFVSVSVIKLRGLRIGHRVTYSFGKFSTLFSLFVVFLSNGFLPFFGPGTFKSTLDYKYRHGHLRPGLQLKDLAKLSILGSFSSLGIAFLAKLFMLGFPTNLVLSRIMIVSITFAIVNMLPFPEFNGFHVFYCSRLLYFFWFAAIIAIGVFFMFLGIIPSIILGFLVGGASWLLFYFAYESRPKKL